MHLGLAVVALPCVPGPPPAAQESAAVLVLRVQGTPSASTPAGAGSALESAEGPLGPSAGDGVEGDASRGGEHGPTDARDDHAGRGEAPPLEEDGVEGTDDGEVIGEAPPEPTAPDETPPPVTDVAPEPEHPQEEERPAGWRHYVHTREADAVASAPDDAEYISARSTLAERDQRTWVTATEDGESLSEWADEAPSPWSPGVPRPRPTPQETLGDTPEHHGRQARPAPSGGAARPQDGTAADRRGAAAAPPTPSRRPSAESRPRGGRAGVEASRATRSGVRTAEGGGHVSGEDAPSWWSPQVSFVRPAPSSAASAASPAPTAIAPEVVEAPTRRAPPEPGLSDDEAGPVQTEDPEAVESAVEEAPTADVPDTPTPDPVTELRDALGWGRLDERRHRQRRSDAGAVGSTGADRASDQTVLREEDDAIGEVTVGAADTPLGRYLAEVERRIRERWLTRDLDPVDKALGIRGTTVVQFRVRRNGLVEDKRYHRRSGHPKLDTMARDAIPSRLPRFPRALSLDSFVHRITLHYRNPQLPADEARAVAPDR